MFRPGRSSSPVYISLYAQLSRAMGVVLNTRPDCPFSLPDQFRLLWIEVLPPIETLDLPCNTTVAALSTHARPPTTPTVRGLLAPTTHQKTCRTRGLGLLPSSMAQMQRPVVTLVCSADRTCAGSEKDPWLACLFTDWPPHVQSPRI